MSLNTMDITLEDVLEELRLLSKKKPKEFVFLKDYKEESKALFAKLKSAVKTLPLEQQFQVLNQARHELTHQLLDNMREPRLPCIVCSKYADTIATCGHEACVDCRDKHGEECPLNRRI